MEKIIVVVNYLLCEEYYKYNQMGRNKVQLFMLIDIFWMMSVKSTVCMPTKPLRPHSNLWLQPYSGN